MRKRFAPAVAALLMTLAMAVAQAAPAAGPQPLPPFRLSPNEYFPVSQVRPGMKGYGLTVFKGVEIEKFAVEVVGVMPQGDMGRPLVLVMLKGGPITERQANLIRGMSGSPIYIDGRLLGAFALGDASGREALGMVRPIEDMIDAFDPRLPARPLFAAAPSGVGADAPSALPAATPFRAMPLPLIAAGASARTIQTLNEGLRPLGVEVMAAPGGAPANQSDIPSYFPKNVPLVPGASLAVSLMQGDVDLTAIGVVTYRKGNRILAFGHPFLQLGPAEYPASTAYIHDVFSSSVVSHKYGSPIRTVGTIQHDGPFSVSGLLHRLPAMIPMTVHVNDAMTGRKQDFNIRMVNHPMLLPTLILSGAQEVVSRVRPYPGESMANVTFTIVPEGRAPITRSNTFFSASSITSAALADVADALVILSRNPFEPVKIKRVDIRVNLMEGHNTAIVQRAWVEKNKVQPGDTLTVQALIKPYKQPTITRTVEVKIPDNAPAGTAQVIVYGGDTGYGTITAAPAPPSGSAVATSTLTANVDQLVTRYMEQARNDDLGVSILLPGSVVSVDGERFSGLPDPFVAVMKSTKASNTRLERDEVRHLERVPYVLSGAQTLNITVEKRNAAERSAVPSTPASRTASPEPEGADVETDSDSTELLALASAPAGRFRPGSWLRFAEEKPADASDAAEKPAGSASDASDDEKPASGSSGGDASSEPASKPADTSRGGSGPGRVAKEWKQVGQSGFGSGRLANASVNTSGALRLAPRLGRVAETTQPYIWSLLPWEDGGVLAGTGNSGDILRVDPEGGARVFARVDDLQVHALVRDGRGGVYAGTSPNGRIARVDGAGTVRPFFETGQRFVLALAVDDRGNLYAGTGPEGRLFTIAPSGAGRELVRLPGAQIVCLAMDTDGSLLAGTAPDGLVYRIQPDGAATVVFDASESTVTAIAIDDAHPKGRIVVATAPSGKVYRVLDVGRSETLLEKAEDSILALVARADGTVIAAGGKTVYSIAPDRVVSTLDNDDQNQIVSLAIAEDGSLWAGSANTGIVYRGGAGNTGNLVSSVHDAGVRARWGRLEYVADVPPGARIEVQTRSGNVAHPDATWSEWSSPSVDGASASVESPAGRFIQYRATLTAAPNGDSPGLHWVSVRYLTENRPPTVKFTDPKDGDRWSGKKTVRWTGSDPDSDVVNYTLYASADGGATWDALNTQKAAPVEAESTTESPAEDATAKAAREAKNNETARKVEAELGKHPDLSPEMRTAILQTATSVLKGTGESASGESAEGLSSTSYVWNTADREDGVYRLKIVATDKASNPLDALTAEAVTGPIMVANAAPTVTVQKDAIAVASDRTVSLTGTATSPSAAILRVSYRVDGGDWRAAAPADGIFDSPEETWTFRTDALESGERSIEVKVSDEVDNSATTVSKVTVS